MPMQKKQNSSILQTKERKKQDGQNAKIRRQDLCRIPTNHRQAERKLIKAVESGELFIDKQGRIWRRKLRKGKKKGGSQLVCIETRRAEHKVPLGYLEVKNTIGRKRIYGCAHRLVWQYFFGDIPDGLCINHKNGVKDDNRPENLEIVTYSENRKHGFRIGIINQDGEKNPNAKISNDTVESIRQLYSTGQYKQGELASKFNVSFQSVSRIIRGETRKSQVGLIDKKDHRNCKASMRDKKTGQFKELP